MEKHENRSKNEKILEKALQPAAERLAEEQVDKLLAKGMVSHTQRDKLMENQRQLQMDRLQSSMEASSQKMGQGFIRLRELASDMGDDFKRQRALGEIENAIKQMAQFSRDFLEQLEKGEEVDERFIQEKLGSGFEFSDEAFIDLYEIISGLYKESRYEEAFLSLTALCFVKPASFNLWIARGMAAYQCGMLDDALASYQVLKQMYPEDPTPYPYLIDVLIAKNETEKARQELYNFQDAAKRSGEEDKWKSSLVNIERALDKSR